MTSGGRAFRLVASSLRLSLLNRTSLDRNHYGRFSSFWNLHNGMVLIIAVLLVLAIAYRYYSRRSLRPRC